MDPFAFPDDEPLQPIAEDDTSAEEEAPIDGPEEDTPKVAAKKKSTKAELFAAARKKAAEVGFPANPEQDRGKETHSH